MLRAYLSKGKSLTFVVSRLALHHMLHPAEVVREMVRVCRLGGTVLVEDIYGSEHSERAGYQDRWEKLRDPSHVRTLPITELLQLFQEAGLETDSVSTYEDLCPEVERWLATTKTPPRDATEVRSLLGGGPPPRPEWDTAVSGCQGTPPFPRQDCHTDWTKVQAPGLTVSYLKQST